MSTLSNIAFTTPLIPISHHRNAKLTTTRPILMGLRNTSRPYNTSFNRSQRPRTQLSPITPPSNNGTGDNGISNNDISNNGISNNGTGNNGVSNNGTGDNGHWHDSTPPPPPEITALLRKANRTFSALPPEARLATAEQLSRLLAIERTPLLRTLSSLWPALRHRLVANARLPMQLGVELSVGFVSKTLAELQGRGDKFAKQFDLYLSNLALELVADAMLVWLLCPVAVFGAPGKGALAALPKHFAQMGGFSPAQRGGALLVRGGQFAVVGVLSSLIGGGVTAALAGKRREGEGRGGEEGGRAPVLATSVVWGGFMMTSSNLRYQIVNGLEQRVFEPALGGRGLTMASFVLRFANCFMGGVQWLPFARYFGIQ